MPIHLMRTFLLFCLLIINFLSKAQQNIIISDDLAAQAEEMKVKMGTQKAGKIWDFSFGDFTVTSSKNGWLIQSEKYNIFNTRSESKSNQKFSFVLSNKANVVARVNATFHAKVKLLHEFQLFPGFSLGDHEVLEDSRNFMAIINIDADTSETWTLLMYAIKGLNNENKLETVLTNKDKKILVIPVTSSIEDNRKIVALGYEFIENNQSLCALQYYGGGLMGMNKNIVWMRRNLDNKKKTGTCCCDDSYFANEVFG